MTRKNALLAAAIAGVLALAPFPARSDEPVADVVDTAGPQVKELSAQGVRAIARGLAWLADHQQEDGSYRADIGFKLNDGYQVEHLDRGHPGITALAGMAFLAGGNVPGRGRYGKNVERAVKYILSCVQDDGMISANGTRMYSHAFATLFLAETYGMSHDSRVKAALEAATKFTWGCQNTNGGWRYAPLDQDSDMSITVCQVMALRAARNIGIRVPKGSIDRAIEYVLRSAETTPNSSENGSFIYQYRPENPVATRNTYSLTAAGLATLYMAGLYSDEDILQHIREKKIDRFLRRDPPPRIAPILGYLRREYPRVPNRTYFFYYGNYYAVQAMFTAGGLWWEDYFRKVQADLVALQNDDGSWPIMHVGQTFSTAVGCIVLQVPYRYLPILTR